MAYAGDDAQDVFGIAFEVGQCFYFILFISVSKQQKILFTISKLFKYYSPVFNIPDFYQTTLEFQCVLTQHWNLKSINVLESTGVKINIL